MTKEELMDDLLCRASKEIEGMILTRDKNDFVSNKKFWKHSARVEVYYDIYLLLANIDIKEKKI